MSPSPDRTYPRFESVAVPALPSVASRDLLTIPVVGTSMLPLLRPGDLIEVAIVRAADLLPGEVAVFVGRSQLGGGIHSPTSAEQPDSLRTDQPSCLPDPWVQLVVHRFLYREGARLIARGDNAPSTDLPWNPEQLLGVVRAVCRNDQRRSLETMGQHLAGRVRAGYWRMRRQLARSLSRTR